MSLVREIRGRALRHSAFKRMARSSCIWSYLHPVDAHYDISDYADMGAFFFFFNKVLTWLAVERSRDTTTRNHEEDEPDAA
jgi:hypothetical protein